MGTRAYKRDGRGRFAGAGGATTTTYGKAGGFANAGLRARAQSSRAKSRNGLSRKTNLRRRAVVGAATGIAVLAVGGAIRGATR